MPPDMRRESSGREDRGHGHKERIGNYILGNEIGRGSFATVYKGYRSRTRETVAIKAVSRQKLTTKLLENLESEINILKSIKHRNITALEECFKNESHIYLVMEFCSGSDLSIYIKNRGQLPTLDYYPRGSFSGDKIYYPHPLTGGLDERVTRSFLGQLAYALEFLRKKDLIHRDIKPQNLLLQPASEAELANGHPHGIPVLKVADFGFARILPATAMAETLCGSPLYMAPEILRYEKYDAKVDLWSVGAVLFEMAVGKPPFRANNHVELLRKIEKGEDRIKFPDESSRLPDPNVIPPLPVPLDIKGLIRALLKRHSVQRMSFEAFFGSSQIWEGYMYESRSTVEGSLDLDVSSESSEAETNTGRLQEMVDSVDRERAQAPVPTHAPQPISTQPALNPQPAKVRSDLEERRAEYTPRATPAPLPQPVAATPPVVPAAPVDHSHLPPFARPPPVRRSEPKYYVQDDTPSEPEPPVVAPTPSESSTRPRPIQTPSQRPHRRFSSREPGSVEEAQPITPGSNQPPPLPRSRTIGEGSPLAATPPITMTTGKDESALEADDSMVAQEYVVIDKGTVQVNALADGQWHIVADAIKTTDAAEVDQASKKPHSTALTRRPSSRTSVVSRPVSSFRPAPTTTSPTATTAPQPTKNAVVPMSYSPPFGLSTTPPFAIPAVSRQQSSTALNQLRRQPSIPQNLNVFPPAQLYEPMGRFGSSPSSLQTGTLARALTNTAIKLIGTSASAATNAIARATATAAARQRPTIIRSGEIHPAEEELLRKVEDVARKAFALFELADQRLGAWQHLATIAAAPGGTGLGISPRRKSSSSSVNSDVLLLRQQEAAAGEAVVLFCKALMFIVQGTTEIQRYWERKASEPEYETSQDLNDMVQWLRARFNECYEKADFAKSKCADELPFVDKLLHDTARDMSRNAARAELSGDYASAEAGYESAIWLLMALLDDVMYEGGHIREDDKATVDKLMASVKSRAEALKRKIDAREANPAAAISHVQ